NMIPVLAQLTHLSLPYNGLYENVNPIPDWLPVLALHFENLTSLNISPLESVFYRINLTQLVYHLSGLPQLAKLRLRYTHESAYQVTPREILYPFYPGQCLLKLKTLHLDCHCLP